MITLRHLKIFVSLYDNKGNMTKTAELCFIAQPAISLALSELEDNFHVRLFDRVSRRLYVNEAGTRLYGYAKRILNMFEDMENGMKNLEMYSTLRVGCCDSMDACGLPKYISGFTEIHPGVTIRSSVDTSDSLTEKILMNQLDVAIIDKQPVSRQLIAQEFVASKLALGIAPSFGYTDGQEISMEEFVKLPLLLREKGSGTRQCFDQALASRGYQVEPLYESVGTGYAANAALQGLGVAVLPERMMLGYRRKKRLVFIKIKDVELEIIYWIIYQSEKELSQYSKDFIKMCRELELKNI